VDCIRLLNAPPIADRRAAAANARRRFDARTRRLERIREEKSQIRPHQAAAGATNRKRETIARALARARKRLEKPER
jgi:hypothetical protein